MKLTELKSEQRAVIKDIHMKNEDKRRLQHLGFYEGAEIRFIRAAPMHDPRIYEVCGNEIILREKDAQYLEVEVIS